jgi:hypothetical protein
MILENLSSADSPAVVLKSEMYKKMFALFVPDGRSVVMAPTNTPSTVI